MQPYPLLTQPVFKDYIWGGRRLGTQLGKEIPPEGEWAESWEIVDHAQQQSVISNGEAAGMKLTELAKGHRRWLLGQRDLASVPLLLKYLDCQRVLSVQVHPEDSYAKKMSPPDLGKTEAWYIVDADPGALLYAGLKECVSALDLRNAIDGGTVDQCLHTIEPKAGDCVFIPAGTVHALGAGLLVAEIQQASNTTFRLFDWNRLGHDGRPRELHIEQSMEVIDFDSGPRAVQMPKSIHDSRENLVQCDKFVLDRLFASGSLDNSGEMHFVTVPSGTATIHWSGGAEVLATGQSAILPAALEDVRVELENGGVLLDMYLPA
ncbi:MAG: class I mannose-6-phosphate isomerase [Aureliella sp.]